MAKINGNFKIQFLSIQHYENNKFHILFAKDENS